MKRLIVLLAFVIVFVATPAWAEGMYIGVGGSYVYEDIDTGIGTDFDNTQGLNLRAGYNINNNLAVEVVYDYLDEFNMDNNVIDATLDIETLMLAVKLSAGDKIRPYLTGGAGVMQGKLNISTGQSESETDLCAKAGAGIDYKITDDMSLMTEAAYIFGFDDLDDIGYTQITCGVAYHF